MTFNNKVFIVTGGVQGIGWQVCYDALRNGAQVAILDLDPKLDEVIKSLQMEFPNKVFGQAGNVADVRDVEEFVNAVLTTFGKVDVLVNSAGITRDNLVLRMREEDWDKVLDVNLKGSFNTTKAVLRSMMKQRSGCIINIASIVGETGNPGQANYCASKGGIIAMTKSNAKEFASRGIRVNAVAPGFIDTRMTKSLPDQVKEGLLKNIPLGRMGAPEDISNAILFLASDQASYITGTTLDVNGGMF